MALLCTSVTATGQSINKPAVFTDDGNTPVMLKARYNTPMATRLGDVDVDGRVNINDVTTLIDMLLNGDGAYFAGADVDSDGVVNISDVTTLIDMLLNGSVNYNYGKALYDLNEIYLSMHLAGWTTTGNTHQCFGISAYNLMAEVMGDDMIMGAQGSGWFWYDALYNVKTRYTTTTWRSYDLWNAYYTWIANANYIFEATQTMSGATASEKNYIKGQAYAIRAYSYFMLAQSFARTYKGHENDPCVPIFDGLTFNGSTNQPRSTVAQVYARIDADLDEAISLLEGTTQMTPEHMGYAVALGLKSRIALVKEDWATAYNSAVAAINASGKSIQEVTAFKGLNDASAGNVMWAADIMADQVGMYASLWAHMDYNKAYYQLAPKQISKWLYNKMSETDARRAWWGENNTGFGSDAPTSIKFNVIDGTEWGGDYIWMRIEEMYLNAAEAACRQGNESLAKQQLMALMAKRDPNYSTSKTGTSLGALTTTETGSLLEEILIQRRIELWGEDGRIYTIRRLRQGFERNTEDGWPASLTLTNRSLTDPESYPWVMTIPLTEFMESSVLNVNYDQNPLGDYPEGGNVSTGPQNISFTQAEYKVTTAEVNYELEVTLTRTNTNGYYSCPIIISKNNGTSSTTIAYFPNGSSSTTITINSNSMELGETYSFELKVNSYDVANATMSGLITTTKIDVKCENVNPDGQHISFESANQEFITENNFGSFKLTLTRRVADGEYRAVITMEDNPGNMSLTTPNVVFKDGELTADVEVYCYNISSYGTYSCVLKLSDADIATAVPFVPQITSTTVTVLGSIADWVEAGTCTFTDYTWEDGFSASNVPIMHKEGTNQYCIVSPLSKVYTSSYTNGQGDTANWFFYLNDDGSISADEGESLNYWGFIAYYVPTSYPSYCYITQDGNTYDVHFLLISGESLYTGGRFVFTWDR